MKQPEKIRIDLSSPPRDYDIMVGENILSMMGTWIDDRLGKRRCIIMTDTCVGPLLSQRTEAVLVSTGHEILRTITIPSGEGSKSLPTLHEVMMMIFDCEIDRKTVLIALGGGVIGDLTGFVASITLRGLDFIQVPTTLLSQVDSSVGGKTGINSVYGKNTVGTFYQPRLVVADISTLDSLPSREMMAGYAEIVKYGLILDPEFFSWCDAHGAQLLMGDITCRTYAVSKSCQYKAQIVAEDEREAGKRALLNLGHTFAHALESGMSYSDKLNHGEAVSIGMVMAFRLSSQLGLCPENDAVVVEDHLQEMGLPVRPPEMDVHIDDLMGYMAQDKKASNGQLNLVLAHGIGKAFLAENVDPAPVRKLWQMFLA